MERDIIIDDYKGQEVYVVADIDVKYVDDSFSHEFGVERRGHYEIEKLDTLICESRREPINYEEDKELMSIIDEKFTEIVNSCI